MARTIAISDEVYELLKRSKLPGESFSTVIKRNLRRGRLSEITDTSILSQEDWAATGHELAAAEALTRHRAKDRLGCRDENVAEFKRVPELKVESY